VCLIAFHQRGASRYHPASVAVSVAVNVAMSVVVRVAVCVAVRVAVRVAVHFINGERLTIIHIQHLLQ